MAKLSDEKLLTRTEVEEKFGLSRRFLEVAAVKGGGPRFAKIGASVRYQVGDVRAWIEDQKRGSTSEGATA